MGKCNVQLTPREHEVMQAVLTCRKFSAIAESLGISIHTVNFHTRNVRKKLNATTTFEAAIFFVRNPKDLSS